MITVISGTNRPNSASSIFAKYAFEQIKNNGNEVQYLALENFPFQSAEKNPYAPDNQSGELKSVMEKYIVGADKFYFVIPEYNGSFPGVLKYFLDLCSVHEDRGGFANKKAGLLGVAAGRAGNLRGLDHLTTVLNYVNTAVLPNRLPVSGIGGLLKDGKILDKGTQEVIQKHLVSFLAF